MQPSRSAPLRLRVSFPGVKNLAPATFAQAAFNGRGKRGLPVKVVEVLFPLTPLAVLPAAALL